MRNSDVVAGALALALVSLAAGASAEEQATPPAEDATKASATATPAPAPPAGVPERAISVGARVSAGIPFGNVNGNTSFSDIYAAGVPIGLDAGYKPSSHWYVGVYYSIAPTFAGARTNHNTSDGGANQRIGLNAHYHVSPQATFDPWFGLGVGYDYAEVHADSSTIGISSGAFKGIEFVNAQVGADYKLTPTVGLGPVLSLSLSDYLGGVAVLNDGTRIASSPTLHGWFTLGVRVVYDSAL